MDSTKIEYRRDRERKKERERERGELWFSLFYIVSPSMHNKYKWFNSIILLKKELPIMPVSLFLVGHCLWEWSLILTMRLSKRDLIFHFLIVIS